MEKLKIKKLGYGLQVTDATQEFEIYVLGSPGQSGSCSLVVVIMAVDGGYRGIQEVVANIPYGDKREAEIPDAIWAAFDKIGFFNAEQIESVVDAWNEIGS